MSAFLGPIHYQLFNKIICSEDRSFAIASAMEKCGKDAEVMSILTAYGEKMANKELADLVGDNSIHNFLYGLITKVDLLEAQLIGATDDSNYQQILDAVQAHGSVLGQKFKTNKDISAENIFQFVRDYYLEGMPCDPGAEVKELDQNRLTFNRRCCNHIPNWEYTTCSNSKMCTIHNTWIKGFISGISGTAEYILHSSIADGATKCTAEIKLGS